MILVNLILGTLCLILSGMWFGTICTDHVNKIKINFTQYFMTTLTLIVGLCQLAVILKIDVL